MKVYTHYYQINENIGMRWRTLLQFGTSWDIIGTVVMKNPGSSAPKSSKPVCDDGLIKNLSVFDESDNQWFEFSADDTMRKTSVLFASYYGLDSVKDLNGVVQVFNMFYVMDADLASAKDKLMSITDVDNMLEYDLEHIVPPVYLGFGNLAFTKEFERAAHRYFDALFQRNYPTAYLSPKFDENCFYHPQYLCGTGCNNQKSKYIRGKFKTIPMSDEDIVKGVKMPETGMSKQETMELIHTLYSNHDKHGLKVMQNNDKTVRFYLPRSLQITFSVSGNVKGFAAIRHVSPIVGKRYNYIEDDFEGKDILDDLILNKYGFYRDSATKAWIGSKSLEEIGDENMIFEFIADIINDLNAL